MRLVVECMASLADDEPSQENGAWFQLNSVFRLIVTGRSGNVTAESGIVTADSGIVTDRSGIVTGGVLEGFEGCV